MLLGVLLITLVTSKAPLIGVVSAWDDIDDCVKRDYMSSIMRAGGLPIIIPVTDNETLVADFISHVDGLLIPGGHDVNPLIYGQDPIPEMSIFIPLLDTFHSLAIAAAMNRSLPIFGICRGMQIMNVFFGGTLIQDIPAQVTSSVRVKHQQDSLKAYVTHGANISEGSHLAALIGKTSVFVNSFHHQAVGDVAPGFVIAAVAADGVVEAIEKSDNPRVYGVQWHPEGMVHAGDEENLPLFRYLVQQASEMVEKKHK